MKNLALILSTLLLSLVSQSQAANSVSFNSLMQQYSAAKLPTKTDLLNHAWGFVAVVGNSSLQINQGSNDRIDYKNGIKNPDGSLMYLSFRDDAPVQYYPFLAMDRIHLDSANSSEYFNRVNLDETQNNISYSFGSAGGVFYTNTCRLTVDQFLVCPTIFTITDQAAAIYKTAPYQQANGQAIVIQVFRRDLE
jgi:hypothetical protein